MTTTFAGTTLPDASKLGATPQILLRETVLLSGKRYIQPNTHIGESVRFSCFGTKAEYLAIRNLIGVSGTLVTDFESFTKCYISALSLQESENPIWFAFSVEFKQDTT